MASASVNSRLGASSADRNLGMEDLMESSRGFIRIQRAAIDHHSIKL